eukprot:TRINITY_DN6433_c0_g1_i1.p1 TRINITY_DN6433_c0_g1~~TRINITY_DN6433_c0_g1_i1.p1  ORF type:complete len:908 (+),score=118.41 TRINITY_DN6433_c0_g1_i1:112-2835(+)
MRWLAVLCITGGAAGGAPASSTDNDQSEGWCSRAAAEQIAAAATGLRIITGQVGFEGGARVTAAGGLCDATAERYTFPLTVRYPFEREDNATHVLYPRTEAAVEVIAANLLLLMSVTAACVACLRVAKAEHCPGWMATRFFREGTDRQAVLRYPSLSWVALSMLYQGTVTAVVEVLAMTSVVGGPVWWYMMAIGGGAATLAAPVLAMRMVAGAIPTRVVWRRETDLRSISKSTKSIRAMTLIDHEAPLGESASRNPLEMQQSVGHVQTPLLSPRSPASCDSVSASPFVSVASGFVKQATNPANESCEEMRATLHTFRREDSRSQVGVAHTDTGAAPKLNKGGVAAGLRWFVCGDGEWLSQCRSDHFANRYRAVLKGLGGPRKGSLVRPLGLPGRAGGVFGPCMALPLLPAFAVTSWVLAIASINAIIAVPDSTAPETAAVVDALMACSGSCKLAGVVYMLTAAGVAWLRPFARPYDNVCTAAVELLQGVAVFIASAEHAHTAVAALPQTLPGAPLAEVGDVGALFTVAAAVTLLQAVLGVIGDAVNYWSDRRHIMQVRQFQAKGEDAGGCQNETVVLLDCEPEHVPDPLEGAAGTTGTMLVSTHTIDATASTVDMKAQTLGISPGRVLSSNSISVHKDAALFSTGEASPGGQPVRSLASRRLFPLETLETPSCSPATPTHVGHTPQTTTIASPSRARAVAGIRNPPQESSQPLRPKARTQILDSPAQLRTKTKAFSVSCKKRRSLYSMSSSPSRLRERVLSDDDGDSTPVHRLGSPGPRSLASFSSPATAVVSPTARSATAARLRGLSEGGDAPLATFCQSLGPPPLALPTPALALPSLPSPPATPVVSPTARSATRLRGLSDLLSTTPVSSPRLLQGQSSPGARKSPLVASKAPSLLRGLSSAPDL